MNWNGSFAQSAAEAIFQRQVEEANRQREVLGLGRWSDVAVEAYRGVVLESVEYRKRVEEGKAAE